MKFTPVITALSLSLTLGFMAQIGHAAAIKATDAKISLSPEKSSLIEKALQQQKQGTNTFRNDNDLKVLTEIKVAPAQSFLLHKIKNLPVLFKSSFRKIILN